MSWTSAYRLALHLLPAALRRKHGRAMETLFARELERASASGPLQGALAGVVGVWDAARRGVYERMRLRLDTAQPAGAGGDDPQRPPTTRQLLRRHAVSFAVTYVALTAAMVALFAAKGRPAPMGMGSGPVGTMIETVLLAVPFTSALTIPMAILIAVLQEFTRLRTDGTLVAARRGNAGVRRLAAAVLAAALAVAAVELALVAEVVPRTNQRLVALYGWDTAPRGRTMTIGQLQAAVRSARAGTELVDVARAAEYEVEIQKKLALPAACVIMALTGMAVAVRARRGGAWLVIGVSSAVFIAYYKVFIRGETLANQLLVSPVVGMWGANVLLLALALLVLWPRRAPLAPHDNGSVVIRG